MQISRVLRVGAVAFGAAVLIASGSAIASAVEEDTDVDINVEVTELTEPGVLALSVAADSTTLTENGSTELIRQFTGTLPTVTVTDTRTAAQIPAGAEWSVLGSASDFTTAGTPAKTIAAENLGWNPSLVQSTGEDFISEGDDVQPVLSNGPGLVDQELLFLTTSSGDAAAANGGQYSANADLFLRVPSTVEAGNYTSVLTLSLFE